MIRYIYHLVGSDGRVRYVGCSVAPEMRMANQRSRAMVMACPTEFQLWLRKEMKAGREVQIVEVRKARPDWRVDEREEMRRMLDAGEPLLNTMGLGIDPQGAFRERERRIEKERARKKARAKKRLAKRAVETVPEYSLVDDAHCWV